jgi:hypothetical protein
MVEDNYPNCTSNKYFCDENCKTLFIAKVVIVIANHMNT